MYQSGALELSELARHEFGAKNRDTVREGTLASQGTYDFRMPA